MFPKYYVQCNGVAEDYKTKVYNVLKHTNDLNKRYYGNQEVMAFNLSYKDAKQLANKLIQANLGFIQKKWVVRYPNEDQVPFISKQEAINYIKSR